MIGKCYIIIFFVFFVCVSVQAEIKETDLVFSDHFTSKILSGEKENIKYVVNTWITLLLEAEEGKNLYPSNLKTEDDFRQFLQLLETADTKKDSLALIDISDAYLSSVEKAYSYMLKNIPFFQADGFTSLYDFNVFLEYLMEEQRINNIVKEWYISFVFLSLAGFSSSYGKTKYISSIERFWVLHHIFNEIFNRSMPSFYNAFRRQSLYSSSGQAAVINRYFKNAVKFQKDFYKLHDIYINIVLPSFTELSWVKHDVKYSDDPVVLFKYGRILLRAYGEKDKGEAYISFSVKQGYLPAVKYLGEYYLSKQGFFLNEGERLMIKYLKESKNFIEKIKIAYKLFSVNIMRGHDKLDSFQKGVSSLRKSCEAIFTSNKTVRSE